MDKRYVNATPRQCSLALMVENPKAENLTLSRPGSILTESNSHKLLTINHRLSTSRLVTAMRSSSLKSSSRIAVTNLGVKTVENQNDV